MSDTPVGPDWWLASDGKWYPPTASSAAPTPGGSGVRGGPPGVSRTLSGWLQGIMWASLGAWLLSALLVTPTRTALDDHNAGTISSAEWEEAAMAFVGMNAVALMLTAVAVVLLVIWTYKAHKASELLGPTSRRWSKGWAIGGWFIPFASALIPKLVLGEIERIARASRTDGLADPEWRQQRSGPLGWVWWVAFIGGFAVWSAAVNLWDWSQPFADPDVIDEALVIHLGAALIMASAGALGALFVRQLGRLLAPDSLTSEVVYY